MEGEEDEERIEEEEGMIKRVSFGEATKPWTGCIFRGCVMEHRTEYSIGGS